MCFIKRVYIFLFFLVSCGNTQEKTYEENIFYENYKEDEIICMEEYCTEHNDCKCIGANLCIPSMAFMDPNIEEINICTIKNCSVDSTQFCSPGWYCYEIPMANSFFEDAQTICILEMN